MVEPTHTKPVHRFDREAMNTLFSLRIFHPDRKHALLAASACFRKIEGLETCLSRYREESDVSRINILEAGEQVFIDEETYACLVIALQASAATGGLFDVTLGAAIEHRKQESQGKPPLLRGKIELDPDRPIVSCTEPGRIIDLGGIGKGFALDRMAQILGEHDIHSALLSCAGSTSLAIGQESWPNSLQGDHEEKQLQLRGEALSASGLAFQGSHIFHPRNANHAYSFSRVWVTAREAALADAFSTACLLMEKEELARFRASSPMIHSILTEDPVSGKIASI